MQFLKLLKVSTITSLIVLSGCESDQPQVDLCFIINHVDDKPVEPYLGCSDPKGVYYEIDIKNIKANLYRAVSPDDFDKLRKYYGGKPDSGTKTIGTESN